MTEFEETIVYIMEKHPAFADMEPKECLERLKAGIRKNSPKALDILKEAFIIFELSDNHSKDRTDTPTDQSIERLMQLGFTKPEAIIWLLEGRMDELIDDLIDNFGSIEITKEQAITAFTRSLNRATQQKG